MFQRFTSVLFGDSLEDSRCSADSDFNEKEEDDEWILVDYLAKTCSSSCEDDLLEICSDDVTSADTPVRCSSCSSLDSDAEENSFLGLEESWFITPPPCFMAGGGAPVLLETSPLENLLIEHPSMSVYAVHSRRRRPAKDTRETSILRSEAQRRHSSGCHTAAVVTPHSAFLEQNKNGRLVQRTRENVERQQLSRNALRRLNLLRDGGTKQANGTGGHVHQPGQRQLNY